MGDRVPHLLRYLILICALAAASFVLANPAAAVQIRNGLDGAGDKTSGTGTYTLSGIVVDASTAAPIRRALVALFAQPSQVVLTDEGGKFQFENLAQGQYGILAHKPGYVDPSGESPAITISADTSALVLKLEPESGIAVKVTGEDGEGVEDLPVRMLSSRVQDGRRYWETHGAGKTNEQGEFRANNLPPGKYFVSVGPSYRPLGQTEDGAQASDLGYPRAYYPNAEELEAAAPVEVNAGRRARLEFVLSAVPLYRISGVVAGGPPGQPCRVQLEDSSGEAMAIGVGVNAITGMFRSGEIAAGFYTLAAQCTVNAEATLTGRMPLRVDSNMANLTLLAAPTVSIPVTFRTNPGSADANQSSPTGAVFMIQKRVAASGISAWSQPETDGDNERIAVKRVEPGAYSVEIHPNSGWYVESARYGAVDLLAEDLTVPDGGTTEAIEITLRSDGASASGNVRASGVAPASGSVLLVPSGAPRLLKVARITNGTFTINDLAPGSYHAIALDRVDDLEYTNPEALKDYLAKAQDVTLSPKQDAHVDLELVQREK
jgi:hypothetical protein